MVEIDSILAKKGDYVSDPSFIFPFCSECTAADEQSAESKISVLPQLESLISESHFNIKIRQCPKCSLKWVSVFTETFSTQTGDSQTFTYVPITLEEESEIRTIGGIEQQLLSFIAPLGASRRYFQREYPNETRGFVGWAFGEIVFAAHH